MGQKVMAMLGTEDWYCFGQKRKKNLLMVQGKFMILCLELGRSFSHQKQLWDGRELPFLSISDFSTG
jgi:hypothetical protein